MENMTYFRRNTGWLKMRLLSNIWDDKPLVNAALPLAVIVVLLLSAAVPRIEAANCAAEGKLQCLSDFDCKDMNGVMGARDMCGGVTCHPTTGTCMFTAWNESCAEYRLCNGVDNVCDAGPNQTVFSGTCTGWEKKECVYEWCPKLVDPNIDVLFENYSCKSLNRNQCTQDSDCVDANGVTGARSQCGGVTCHQQSGTCRFDASVSTCPDFVSCGGDHTKCGSGPTDRYFLGSCSGGTNTTCRYAWCPADPADNTVPSYSCQSQNKTKCTKDSDCEDPDGLLGARAQCGNLKCQNQTGTCYFKAHNETCEDYNFCYFNSSKCANGGPAFLNSPGSCTGWRNIECEYAFCPGDLAPLQSIELSITNNATVRVGDNRKIVALGSFKLGSKGKDISTKVMWTSTNPAVADFTFPSLILAKSQGSTMIRATMDGIVKEIPFVVIPLGSASVECNVREVDMKALVVYRVDLSEPALPAIRRALGYVGVPYDELSITQLWQTSLNDTACRGKYQSIILSDGGLQFYQNGTVDKNGLSVQSYEELFGVRRVNWYTFPSNVFGFVNNVTGSGDDFLATLTGEGRKIFSYLTTDKIPLNLTYKYLAAPLPNPESIPLLLDSSGTNSFLTIFKTGKKEMMTFTVNSNENLRHIILLSYGMVNWVTQGLFVGNRRVYVTAHNDDYLIADAIWTPSTPCGTPTDKTNASYRMDDNDLTGVLQYQQRLSADVITKNFRFDQVYNGVGTSGIYNPDPLTPLTKSNEAQFKWINHGWDHLNLDNITKAAALSEIRNNQLAAKAGNLSLTNYSDTIMVTAQVSGLKNPQYLEAAYELGIRYLVTDTSRQGENPGDNKGLYNWFVPGIFMIPRRPNNLFYNVALREEWVAEYNCLFSNFWGRNLTVYEIIEFESEQLLSYMLRGERYPWMFHQSNMRVYLAQPENKNFFLLEELLEATFAKFKSYYNLPIMSPTMDDLGREVQSHMEIENVTAVLAPGIGMSIESNKDTKTPVTGFTVDGADCMMYGGQKQCSVSLKQGIKTFFAL